jgi:hypothetical protein
MTDIFNGSEPSIPVPGKLYENLEKVLSINKVKLIFKIFRNMNVLKLTMLTILKLFNFNCEMSLSKSFLSKVLF